MEIVWLGHSCFRLRTRDITILTDPYEKEIGFNLGRPAADIVTVSHDHPGHNNVAAVAGSPRALTGPGEYEVKGVPIIGIQTAHDPENGRQRGRNTVYLFNVEDVVVCHLGDLGHLPSTDQVEAMASIDLLLVPVGGKTSLNASEAAEVVSLLEPKIVVPMHFRHELLTDGRDIDSVETFCRDMAAHDLTPQPRLSVTRASLPDETQVVILDPRRV